MSGTKPTCGSTGPAVDGVLYVFFAILGGGGTVATVWGAIAGAGSSLSVIVGVSAPAVVWLAAAAGAVLTLGLIFSFWWNRCLSSPDGQSACAAGVVNGAAPSFISAADEFFPFSAMHDRIDIVVKSDYWPLLTASDAQHVHCADDDDQSPVLHCYYEDPEVCAAGLGSTIGGAAGAVGGIIAAAALAALIGCATIVLCVFAILVAFLVAAAAVVAGALLGGQLAKWAVRESEPEANTGEPIELGDYVTTNGQIVTLGDDKGARVFWFVTDTTLHGRSTASPEFSYRDPDANLVPDACPVNQVE